MKRYIIALMLLSGTSLSAQETKKAEFVAPLNSPLILSGNFGELRANHFHGGLDFRTQGKTGLPVYSIADGYISKIDVSIGSGYMLHVRHKNGYTSIYRHMLGFVRTIGDYAEKYQYQHELDEVSIDLSPNDFPVKAGQQIGWSGNEGYSFGPHLHLDILDTQSGDNVDPLQFLVGLIKDTKAPRAESIMLFPQRGKGVVNGSQSNQSILPYGKRTIEAWGEIGVGIRAHDYMDNVLRHYGVHSITLYVNGKQICNSEMDQIATYENRMVYSLTYAGYIKSFRDPGNTLRFLHTGDDRGIVTINQERDYNFLYVLKDVYGNTSRCEFTVRGRKQNIPEWNPKSKDILKWNELNILKKPGVQLIVPAGMVYQDEAVNFETYDVPGAISLDCKLHNVALPLLAPCELQIGVRNMVTQDTKKYYIAQKIGNRFKSVGGTYSNGYVCADIKELGTYLVKADTIRPRISPVGKSFWGKTGIVSFSIGDNESGVKYYKGRIDGKFALFHFRLMSSRLSCRLDSRKVQKGIQHNVELLVIDNCGNASVYRDTFKW
ncbi:M23 family metallopeptidase [uncultured Bacteroides sp.]|uniref:M23 family metallopeptidase n=1 Tax=uncultured Bacteroides sp. TaxID=162156 RepID=UPI002AA6E5A0|nr:M23 family metallopeptidase [uncultured Bacteroides sp.]